MEIQLDEQEIVNEITTNHFDNPELMIRIVDEGSATFDTMKKVLKGVIDRMKKDHAFDESVIDKITGRE